MTVDLRSRPARYALALALAIGAIALRAAIDGVIGGVAPFVLVLCVTLVASWRLGPGEGVLAGLVGILGSYLLFVRPRNDFYDTAFEEFIGLGSSFLIAGIGVAMSRGRRDSRLAAVEADERRAIAEDAREAERQGRYEALESAYRLQLEMDDQRAAADRVLGRINDLIVLYDAEGRITRVNPAMERFLGLREDECLGRTITELIPLGSEIERWIDEVRAGGAPGNLLYRSKREDRWFDVWAYPSEDGLAVVARDVTEERAAREAARHWEDTYRQATDTLDGFVYRMTPTSVERSAGVVRLLGYGPDEATDKPAWWGSIIHPEDFAGLAPIMAEMERGNHAPYAVHYRVRAKDGRWVWVWDRARPITQGAEVVYVGQTTDFTSEQALRERLDEEAEDARFVAELADRLRSAGDEDVAQVATEFIRHRIPCDRCVWHTIDYEARDLWARGQNGDGPPIPEHLPMDDFPGAVAAVLSGKTLARNRDDVAASEAEREALRAIAVASFLAHPVVLNGRTEAVLCLLSTEPRTWTEREIRHVREIGERIHDAVVRQTAEREMRAAFLRADRVLSSAPQIVWIGAPDGRVIWANDNWDEYFGRPLAESQAEGWTGLIHPEDFDGIIAAWGAATANGEDLEFEYRIRRHDGAWRWHLVRAVTVEEESGTRWYGTLTDIHDLKTARADLDRTEREGRAVLDTVPSAVWFVGRGGKTEYLNPAFRTITGASEAHEWTSSVASEDRERVVRGWIDSRRTRTPLRAEARFSLADGSRRWFAIELSPLTSGEEEPRWFGTAKDIDDTKTAAARLEALVAVRTRELTESNQDLEAFCYSVSHDLRAPLRAMTSAARIVMEDHGEELPDAVKDEMNRQAAAANRMAQLIDDLLELSRIGTAKIRIADVDVAEIARTVWTELRADPERLLIPGPVLARADAKQMRILLQNILDNAIKYAKPEVGPRVTIVERDGEIRISDEGIGFDPKFAEKIFEPFQRLHHATSVEGTGIGLSNVRRVMERHHGRYRVESRPGEGTTFAFAFDGSGSA